MRQTTLQDYNPRATAMWFTLITAVVVAALLTLFAWHPWSQVQTDNSTPATQSQQAPAQPQSQQAPAQPQPQST